VVLGCLGAGLTLASDDSTGWTSAQPISCLAALVAAGFAVRTWRLTHGGTRLAWGLLAVYTACYALADGLSKGLVTGRPEGVLSDAVYLVVFVPGGLALALYPLLHMRPGMWRPFLIDATLLIVSLTFVAHSLVLHRVYSSGVETVTAVMMSVYPLASTWCAALLLLALARSEGPRRPDVALLGTAFVLFSWGDFAYVFATVWDTAGAAAWSDAFYTLALLAVAAAAAVAAVVPTPRRKLRRHLRGAYVPVLTDLFALLALALATLVGPRDTTSTVLGMMTVVTLGIRQIALTRASWQLRAALERRIEERTQELAETTEHYERLDALKREFITAVSHELRTPLAAIRGGLEMLEDGDAGELNPMARRLVETASRGSERLSRLVNDIIDLERLDGGVAEHCPVVHPVGDLVRDAVQALAPLSTQHRMVVRLDVEEVDVWCEPDPVIQVLVNLLGNAFKFSEDGTRVVVRTWREGDEVVVSVRDQGRGIPQDQLETIFERFHQIEKDDSREKGGAGLGLSICQLIVRNHGGRIWAESDDSGATFLFTLPAVPPTESGTQDPGRDSTEDVSAASQPDGDRVSA